MIYLIKSRQLITNKQIKTAFSTNGIILTIIHCKISINLLLNLQKLFTVYRLGLYSNILVLPIYMSSVVLGLIRVTETHIIIIPTNVL